MRARARASGLLCIVRMLVPGGTGRIGTIRILLTIVYDAILVWTWTEPSTVLLFIVYYSYLILQDYRSYLQYSRV